MAFNQTTDTSTIWRLSSMNRFIMSRSHQCNFDFQIKLFEMQHIELNKSLKCFDIILSSFIYISIYAQARSDEKEQYCFYYAKL